jgi:hypothetical protein
MTKFSEVVRNPHFANLTAIMRVAFDPAWQRRHPRVPFRLLEERFLTALDPDPKKIDRDEVIAAFTDMIVSLAKADSRLSYTEDDLKWFTEVVDQDDLKAIFMLLAAYWSAPDAYLTPAEVAELTSSSESNWRNKAAAGEIPGAVKKGKQWLLPVSVLRSRGVNVAE